MAAQMIVPNKMSFHMLPLADDGRYVYVHFVLIVDIKSGSKYDDIELSDLLKWTGLSQHDL